MAHSTMRTGVLVFSLLLAPLALADMASLQRMADQLDAADAADFRTALLDAQICIGQRDFACADSKIKISTRYLHTAKDRELLARVRDGLARERQQVERERLAAEEHARREEAARRQQAELEAEANRGPSTASQLLMFGSAVGVALQQQQALRLAQDAAAQRNWQQLQNAGRQQEARNQQLLDNAAAARGLPTSSSASASSGSGYSGGGSSSSSASAGTDGRQPRNSLEAMAGYGQEGTMFDGMSGVSRKSADASRATLDAAAASSGGDTAVQQARAAAACGNEYDGPTDDIQLDTLCQLAAFDACVHRATGVTDYDAEGRKSCQNLKSILEATRNPSYSCRYCPYPY